MREIYTKKMLGEGLLNEILRGKDIDSIANWAYRTYSETSYEFESEIVDIIMSLVAMLEGPEFEYTHEELREIANKLITEEENKIALNDTCQS